METAKRTKKKAAAKTTAPSLVSAYRTYVLENGHPPATVFAFCSLNGITEAEFYAHFGSFAALEKFIWNSYADSAISRLNSDKAYGTFSARERVLAFHFTLAEILKNDRSFVLRQLDLPFAGFGVPDYLRGFKKTFHSWADAVIEEGKVSGEIARRPGIDKRYSELFWMHLAFILKFWARDESPAFENTDAAIEKSVNLAFDLISKGILDNALDFGKFLYQTSKN